MTDIIHNKDYTPTFAEITGAVGEPGRGLWLEIHRHMQEEYQARPKQQYSTCQGKPGWNYKYQKAGKALCTLYPEECGFVALVVIPERMEALILTAQPPFPEAITAMVRDNKPFNHTYWLMISVRDEAMLETVKDLVALKLRFVAETKTP